MVGSSQRRDSPDNWGDERRSRRACQTERCPGVPESLAAVARTVGAAEVSHCVDTAGTESGRYRRWLTRGLGLLMRRLEAASAPIGTGAGARMKS